MYYVEGTHPAIISREVFDRAQKEMAARYGVEVKNGRAQARRDVHGKGKSSEAAVP